MSSDEDYKQLVIRVEKLEKAVFKADSGVKSSPNLKTSESTKTISLAEIARKEGLKKANGQQKVAAIIGYYEKIVDQGPSKPEKVKQGWREGKFSGKYNPAFLNRAIGDLVRSLGNGTYDLTQAGEDFFIKLIK